VQDWAEVHRLFHRDKASKTSIAERTGMSRNTVENLLSSAEPPSYSRGSKGSLVDPFKDQIASLLDQDPKAPASVILEHLRRCGYKGKITILKDYLQQIRPEFVAAKNYQRTSYLPGELGQFDWWHTGVDVPVGKGATREAMGLVGCLPHSAAHGVVYTFGRRVPDFCPAFVGCLDRLGGVPEKGIFDNDSSIVARRQSGRAVFHAPVLAMFGQLRLKGIALKPRSPESKGQVERTIKYLETSFLPLRTFTCLEDLQEQSDDWNDQVARRRHHRRVGAIVGDAWRAEKPFLHPMPAAGVDTDQYLETRVAKDAFVRASDVDYSVPPGLGGRRVQVRLSLQEVIVFHEHHEIARHKRSYVPADVVLAPAHARALRLAREAKARLSAGELELPSLDLSFYDRLVGAGQ